MTLIIVYVLVFQALVLVVILGWLFVPIYIKAGVHNKLDIKAHILHILLYKYTYSVYSHCSNVHYFCDLVFQLIVCTLRVDGHNHQEQHLNSCLVDVFRWSLCRST